MVSVYLCVSTDKVYGVGIIFPGQSSSTALLGFKMLARRPAKKKQILYLASSLLECEFMVSPDNWKTYLLKARKCKKC